jgi:hypothetical protein
MAALFLGIHFGWHLKNPRRRWRQDGVIFLCGYFCNGGQERLVDGAGLEISAGTISQISAGEK